MFGTKLLALDIGSNVIGIALSDSGKKMAFPRDVLLWNGKKDTIKHYLCSLMKEESIEKVVLGYDKGKNNERFQKAYQVVTNILDELALPYDSISEYVTTIEAQHRMEDSGIANAGRLDSIAAQIILERYISI